MYVFVYHLPIMIVIYTINLNKLLLWVGFYTNLPCSDIDNLGEGIKQLHFYPQQKMGYGLNRNPLKLIIGMGRFELSTPLVPNYIPEVITLLNPVVHKHLRLSFVSIRCNSAMKSHRILTNYKEDEWNGNHYYKARELISQSQLISFLPRY